MSNEMTTTRAVIVRGRMTNYRKIRIARDFLLTDGMRQQAGYTAIAAALAGSGGAVGLAGMTGTQEQADQVEFELDGEKVEGVLTWSPFAEGDEVEVLAERSANGYWAFAILRPADRMIALHPHCSRGRRAHFRASVRYWLYISLPIVIFIHSAFVLMCRLGEPQVPWDVVLIGCAGGSGGCLALSGLIALSLSWKLMPYVRMADSIFSALGWQNVQNIDLPASSKKQRRPGDRPGMGTLYFRY
ncbi:hypothetical protein PQR75_30595 [Paraburkholderia fungorum]|uniref:putative type VI secretion system effector n=1 Tax=Paraburkholderia fungorum TaxID=134537 RepID=UPI0038BBDA38